MSDPQHAMIEDIISAHQQIVRAIGLCAPSVWMEIDLSMAQLKVLMALHSNGPLPIGQIADILGIGQPTASHLVDRLVQTQLVCRTEDALDRRRTLAQLAPEGEELVARINQVRFGTLRAWLAHMSEADLHAFWSSSRALADVALAETAHKAERS